MEMSDLMAYLEGFKPPTPGSKPATQKRALIYKYRKRGLNAAYSIAPQKGRLLGGLSGAACKGVNHLIVTLIYSRVTPDG